MTHVEDHNLGVIRIDRVENEIGIANGWEHADARLVRQMTGLRKILEKVSDGLDALNNCGCGSAIVLMNVGEYAVNVRKRTFGPAHFHAL